jgi:hypothetical protein
MVDITSLKVRLARLRLSSNIAEEAKHDRRLEDPVTTERKKKKTKKAAQDPYNEYTTNTGGKRKKKNKLTRSDQKRGSLDAGYGDYTKNTGGKRKKKNKLTRSDQKRGKKSKKQRKNTGEQLNKAEVHKGEFYSI